jgi:hypothetical protein
MLGPPGARERAPGGVRQTATQEAYSAACTVVRRTVPALRTAIFFMGISLHRGLAVREES